MGLGEEEPSLRDEWMEKIADIRVPRAIMNKLVMDYLVIEGFKELQEEKVETDIAQICTSNADIMVNGLKQEIEFLIPEPEKSRGKVKQAY